VDLLVLQDENRRGTVQVAITLPESKLPGRILRANNRKASLRQEEDPITTVCYSKSISFHGRSYVVVNKEQLQPAELSETVMGELRLKISLEQNQQLPAYQHQTAGDEAVH
jgi:hypothetical protein